MALKLTDRESLITNINAVLDTQLNGECSSPSQGQFQLRQTAPMIAALLKIKEFVEGQAPITSTATPKVGGK